MKTKTRAKFRVNKPKLAHLIGIGGKGLAGIAEVLAGAGWKITGSDAKDSSVLERLSSLGVDASVGHSEGNVPIYTDVVVSSSVIDERNPELALARGINAPIISRAEFLGELFSGFPLKIAVAGTHGKSTTTALTGLALERAGLAPTVFGGAPCIEKNDAHGWQGSNSCAVVESCEFRRSFLSLPADYTIVTAFEHAHPECYPTMDDMAAAFSDYFAAHKSGATLILDADAPGLVDLAHKVSRRAVTAGFSAAADYRLISGAPLGEGGTRRDTVAVYRADGSVFGAFATQLPGKHNQKNIGYVAALFDLLGCEPKAPGETLETFRGVRRRFETRETNAGVILVNDFAHHPTQTAHAVLAAKERWPDRELLVVFEPRQCKLVHQFLPEYGGAFLGAKEVVITDPVPALGDTLDDIAALPIDSVLEAVAEGSKTKTFRADNYLSAVDEAKSFISTVGASKATIVTIGPGDIGKVGEILASAYG